nr:TonB-dependent receptor plug domain-containing protein [uncultured Carboxylicivirga sp.]
MKKFILLLFIVFSSVHIYAQKIKLQCTDKPLNELLIEWRSLYNLQFSFNDELLSQFKITRSQTYDDSEKAIQDLLQGLPLSYEKNDQVYIIYAVKQSREIKTYYLIGKIIEKGTNEPLPFSHISANNIQAVTDIKGMFSFSFEGDSVFQVKASHLGCYLMDTVLTTGNHHVIKLVPSVVGLPEVRVTNNIVEKSAQVGEKPGLIKLNHHIANYLPGNGDNSVFNLLKLQPGVTATGENPNDLILWGSSEGTSAVQFDGFTIWGLKNLNDNISAVNPYMVKNVDIMKGGYDASESDFIGGIVDINGRTGNFTKPSFNLFINNQTINGMMELPVGKKSSLIAAYRQNYYDLISSGDVQLQEINNIEKYNWNYDQPNYNFKDLNIKYSLQGDNGDLFYVSVLGGGDEFSMVAQRDTTIDRPNTSLTINEALDVNEKTNQIGAAAFYGKTFQSGHSSSLELSYSHYDNDYNIRSSREFRNSSIIRFTREATNEIEEIKGDWKNHFLINNLNKLTAGLSFIQNNTILAEKLNDSTYIDLLSNASRVVMYAQDELQIAKALTVTAGFRFNYPTHINRTHFDPRISLSYKPGLFKFNASWGIYHQFIARTSIVDDNNRIRYAWYVSGYNDVPVLKSTHYVMGAAYTRKNFLVSLDTYYKKNENLTRYIQFTQTAYVSDGESKSYGLDVYIKKDFNGHSIWTTYSLGRTEELYDYFPEKEYRRAPQDQTHEFKLAGLLNFGSIHTSASYVYGSGFPLFTDNVKYEYLEPDYNRVDVSVIYQITGKKITGEVGLSILNVINNENVKYNSFQLFPIDEFNDVLINEKAIPFTPLLHLKIEL